MTVSGKLELTLEIDCDGQIIPVILKPIYRRICHGSSADQRKCPDTLRLTLET